VPERIFITDKLPKTATGKIQRRHMVAHFMGKDGGGVQRAQTAAAAAPGPGKPLHRSKL
jgi:acyl-coenzyme A synthetase/AMP-(fatty) acid ligase